MLWNVYVGDRRW